MILDAYVNTLFPQEKKKSNFIYLISSSIPVFFLQIWFIEIWIILLMHYMGISILVCMSFSCPDVTDKQKEMHILW